MKKIFCLFGVTALLLASCSNDDTKDSATVFPSKLIENDTDGSVYVSVFTLDGNKIVSLVEDGEKINYTYTGNVITKIVEVDEEDGTDNVIEYTYANGKVSSFVEREIGDNYKYKTVYTYNSNGTVSYKMSSIDTNTNLETENSTGVLTFKEGNIIKEVRTSSDNVLTVTYEYDTKNNPVKNIIGLNLLLDNEQYVSVNNVVKNTEIKSYTGGTETYFYTSSYTYDANGFPTKKDDFDSDGKLEGTIQYFY